MTHYWDARALTADPDFQLGLFFRVRKTQIQQMFGENLSYYLERISHTYSLHSASLAKVTV